MMRRLSERGRLRFARVLGSKIGRARITKGALRRERAEEGQTAVETNCVQCKFLNPALRRIRIHAEGLRD